MNAKKFSDAMSELDTKYVDEALNYKKKAKKPIWVKSVSYTHLRAHETLANLV